MKAAKFFVLSSFVLVSSVLGSGVSWANPHDPGTVGPSPMRRPTTYPESLRGPLDEMCRTASSRCQRMLELIQDGVAARSGRPVSLNAVNLVSEGTYLVGNVNALTARAKHDSDELVRLYNLAPAGSAADVHAATIRRLEGTFPAEDSARLKKVLKNTQEALGKQAWIADPNKDPVFLRRQALIAVRELEQGARRLPGGKIVESAELVAARARLAALNGQITDLARKIARGVMRTRRGTALGITLAAATAASLPRLLEGQSASHQPLTAVHGGNVFAIKPVQVPAQAASTAVPAAQSSVGN